MYIVCEKEIWEGKEKNFLKEILKIKMKIIEKNSMIKNSLDRRSIQKHHDGSKILPINVILKIHIQGTW